MSLVFPDDLDAWQRWQERRSLRRRLKARLRRPTPSPDTVWAAGPAPRVLVVAEGATPSNRAAFLEAVTHLSPADVAVLCPGPARDLMPDRPWRETTLHDVAAGLRVVLAPGHYGRGGRAWELARQRDLPFLVAQHGLLTPLAPPLPDGAHLLAWSQADADFWWSGRRASTTVVGSQLLWEAGREGAAPVRPDARPLYLGQLHGAELPRRDLARAARRFCLEHGATYRPHPSENDRLSRWQHARWERAGLTFDHSGTPLRDAAAPVVGVFSTGVLEAAARGLPAWVDFPRPPAWLREFWDRYDMRSFGGDPTPAPPRGTVEPAAAVAEILRSHL